MQPIRCLQKWLAENSNKDQYLFKSQDFRALFPSMSDGAFKTLLSRSVKAGFLDRVCRGLYVSTATNPSDGLILFHSVAVRWAGHFNYVSLETVLSEAGIISQIPINWISIMTSGRSNIVSCGKYGTIEFIHTAQLPKNIKNELVYDPRYGLWKASIKLAIADMKTTQRNKDLIDWDLANELI